MLLQHQPCLISCNSLLSFPIHACYSMISWALTTCCNLNYRFYLLH